MTRELNQESEESELSAQETLVHIISSLDALPKMQIKIPESIEFHNKENELSEETPIVKCLICDAPMEKSNFFISLKCCGKFAHIQCVNRLVENSGYTIPHCSNCNAEFDASQIQICKRLLSLLQT